MQAVFFIVFEAKEAVEVIKSSDVIMSVKFTETTRFSESLRSMKSIS